MSESERGLQKASRLLEAGCFYEAIRVCSSLVETNPHEVRAYAGRAEAHRQLGNLDEAVADFYSAVNNVGVYPCPIFVYRSLGLVFWKQGKLEEALGCFSKIVTHDYYNPLAWVLMAHMQRLLGNEDLADNYREYALRCLEIHPNPFDSFFETPNISCFSACMNGDIEPAYRLCKVKISG